MHIKALLILATFLFLWWALWLYQSESTTVRVFLAIAFGIAIVLGGFNIFHDVGHDTFFKSRIANRRICFSVGVLFGANLKLWRDQHEHHHDHPNTPDDTDAEVPFLRLHKDQKWKWYHKFQPYYAFILYTLGYFSWVMMRDIRRCLRGIPGVSKPMQGREKWKFFLEKTLYVLFMIGFPLYMDGYRALGLLGIIFITTGFCLALIFQPAHINTLSEAVDRSEAEKMGWVELQLRTTMDFGTRSRFLSFLLGGLNFQAIHHIVRHTPHVKYRAMSAELARLAKESGIPYHTNSFFGAIWSHVQQLHAYGKRPAVIAA